MKKIIIMFMAISMLLVSCSTPNTPSYDAPTDSGSTPSNPTNPITQYTMTFDSNGGSSVNSQTVEPNGHATRPTNPTKEGYVFDYWYIIDESTREESEYNFNSTINSNITLYAKWICVSFELGSEDADNFTYKVEYGTSHWDNVQFSTPIMTVGSYKLKVTENENKIIFEYYKYNNTIANLKVDNVSVNGNVVTIELVDNN